MTVVGVLVEAVVGHQHERIADFVAQRAQRDLHDAVGRVGLRAAGVLVRRDAEEHDRGYTEPGQRAHLLAQAFLRVLHDTRHRSNRLGRVDAFLHEQRRDQIVDAHVMLGDEPPERRRTAKPAHPVFGERHGSILSVSSTRSAWRTALRRGRRSCGDRPRRRTTSPRSRAVSRRDRADRHDAQRRSVGTDRVAEVRDRGRRRERDRVDVARAHAGQVARIGLDGNGAVHGQHRRRSSRRRSRPCGSTSRADSARAINTFSPSCSGSGNAASSDSATKRSGTRSTRMPRRASASLVPGPIAATRRPPSARVSSPAGASPRSKNASTPLADVNTSHAYSASGGRSKSIGSIAIDGSSTTSAPSPSRRARSALACSRARVTTMRRPNSGRCSNQPRSSAATSPTTIALGASTPRSAIVASVPRTVCCSGRVPHRTAATGVVGARPPSINSRAISRDVARAHQHDEGSTGARERVPVGVGSGLGRVLVAGDHREAGRDTPVRDRDPGVRRRGDRARDARHHLERHARRPSTPRPLRRPARTRTGRRP